MPEREYIAGIPEIIKSGLINKSNVLNLLNNFEKIKNRDFNFLSKIIKYSLKTKIKFFKNDIREKNKRLNLNFGHTFAHAIESSYENLSNKHGELIRHGEAVGLGILCEIFYANNNKEKNFMTVLELLKKYSLPYNLTDKVVNKKVFKKEIYKYVFLDKKKISKYPRYIKLKKIGNSSVSELNNFSRIKRTISKVLFDEKS